MTEPNEHKGIKMKNSVIMGFMIATAMTGQLYAQGELVQAKVTKTVLTESFGTPDPAKSDKPKGWNNWKRAGDNVTFIYDKNFGYTDSFSVCLENTNRACWLMPTKVISGATYRLSGYARTESETTGDVALSIEPRIISKLTGNDSGVFGQGSLVHEKIPAGVWTYLETVYQAPVSGEYPEGKLNNIALVCDVQQIRGKVWFDDLKLDIIEINAPFMANFVDGKSLNEWKVYSSFQLEGVTKLTHVNEGFGDTGALAVEYVNGKSGYAAIPKNPVLRNTLGKNQYWTLVARVRSAGDAKPGLAIEQLDGTGKAISTTTLEKCPAKDPKWQQIKLPFVVNDAAISIRPLLCNNNQGQAIFDNVYFRLANQAEKSVLLEGKKPIVWMYVYPADFFAFIDHKPVALTLPSQQAMSFSLQLAGDKKAYGDTIIDVELPDSVSLLAANIGVQGEVTVPFEKLPSTKADYTTYQFKNPYKWQDLMIESNPNYYTGLVLTVKSNNPSGSAGKITIKTKLGQVAGETRELPLIVRDSIHKVSKLNDFKIGIWDLNSLNGRDDLARKELYQTYIDAGVIMGSMHSSHGFATTLQQEQGFTPFVIVSGPDEPNAYNWLPKEQRPAEMILNDGRKSALKIALGLALNDEAVQQKYKQYIKKTIAVLPESANYAVIDIEFWGDGESSKSCFHPSTIAEFRKYAKISGGVELNAEIIIKKYSKEWSDFRNYVTAKLHGNVRNYLREIRPEMKLLAYDYILQLNGKSQDFVANAPMDTLMYDKYIDGHLMSTYNYEGAKFLDNIDSSVKHLKQPVWAVPFIDADVPLVKSPGWGYHHPSAGELRLEIIGAAASGAKGFLPFPGRLLDTDRLRAINSGAIAVANYQDFYSKGTRADEKVTLQSPNKEVRHRVHVLGDKTLLTIFNCGDKSTKIDYRYNGNHSTVDIDPVDFKQILL